MTPTEQLNVVLVGCGGISRTWLKSSRDYPGLNIAGLVDIDRKNARKLQEEFQLEDAHIGSELGDMLDRTGADIVFDCTIPEVHAQMTVEALKRGCHVLGEKPLADSMENAGKMLEAARTNGKTYAVMQNRRYLDSILRFRHLIESNAIGPLTTLNADFYLGAHFGGFRDEMEHVLILDMAIHSFDQARYISGCDPLTVYCHEWNPAGSWYQHGASAMAIFEMSNGMVFTYRGSWCSEGLNTPWECYWRAVGERGSAVWDGDDGIQAQRPADDEGFIRTMQDVDIPMPPALERTGHGAAIAEFLDCVKSGGIPQTICTDNVKSLAMVHAAIESATTGKKVTIEC